MNDPDSAAYNACGQGGTSLRPNNSKPDNEQGFGQFKLKDKDGNVIRNPDKFVNGGAKCGLTHKLGTCASGTHNVFGHIHVGDGYCWESAITLEHECDGHYGYKCLDGDC
ncbi:MAG: hypothetical protein SGARI_002220 [Bacillariaceae sp.]